MARSTSPGVELRVAKALEHIERAQNELAAACAELSAITGGAISFWRKSSKLSHTCRSLWYALEGYPRFRWKLDGMHAEEAAAEKGGGL
jgi:hypothetical protein